MSAPRKVVVVVPFLDEAESLPVLYDRLRGVLEREPEEFELLLVDDGSRDGSAAWATACAERDPRVKLLSLSRNFGHQLAITAGMDHADGDAVVIMDADLQDPPEVVPELLRRWREGHEVVYAVRTEPPRRVLGEAPPRRHLLQDVPPDGERRRAARRRRLPPRRPPGDRRA